MFEGQSGICSCMVVYMPGHTVSMLDDDNEIFVTVNQRTGSQVLLLLLTEW